MSEEYNVKAVIKFSTFSVRRRLSLIYNILLGMTVTFNFHDSNVFLGDKLLEAQSE